MSLTPSSQTVTQGSTVSVTLMENSSTDAVNAVQAMINYPSDKLAFSNISYSTSAFAVQASQSGGSGVVKLSVGTTPPPVTGSQIVAVINFVAIASGSANLTFGCTFDAITCQDGNAVVRESDAANILSTTTGSTVTINTPPVKVNTVIASAPFALSSAYGRTNIFAKSNDGRLMQKWFDGSSWVTNWDNLAGSTVNSTLGGVSWGNGHMDIFEITANGDLRHRYYLPDSTGWRGWEYLGHPGNSPLVYSPAVISSGPGKINVFARGADGRLWEKWFDGQGWVGTWNNLGGDTVNSSMSAISWGGGHVDLFQTNGDGSIWHRYYLPDSTGWRGWSSIGRPNGPSIVSPPAVVSSSYGKVNVFAKGSDGRLWEKWFDGSSWVNSWNNVLGTSVSSTPSVVTWGGGHVDLFETTSNGTVRHMYYLPDSTGWRGWQPL